MFVPKMLTINSKNKYTAFIAAEDQILTVLYFIVLIHEQTTDFIFQQVLALNTEDAD